MSRRNLVDEFFARVPLDLKAQNITSSNRKCLKLIQVLCASNCPFISRSTTEMYIYSWLFRTTEVYENVIGDII